MDEPGFTMCPGIHFAVHLQDSESAMQLSQKGASTFFKDPLSGSRHSMALIFWQTGGGGNQGSAVLQLRGPGGDPPMNS